MFNDSDYVTIGGIEVLSTYPVGIRIAVVADAQVLKAERVRDATYRAIEIIQAAIGESQAAADPKAQQAAASERTSILAAFGDEAIFVEEIPNGYCSQYCCKHLPWFVVTTRIGRFKIGWRKRVISIDWSQCPNTKIAEELFPQENVTKDERLIHAWSYEKAKEYITAVIIAVGR